MDCGIISGVSGDYCFNLPDELQRRLFLKDVLKSNPFKEWAA